MRPRPRGGTRASCNNCHQKKRKCDLPSRLKDGEQKCSRCAAKERECYIGSPNSACPSKRQRLEHTTPSSSPDERLAPDETNLPSTLPQLPFHGETPTAESQEDPGALTERRNYPPSLSSECTAATFPPDVELSARCSTDLSELNSQGSSFLHHVFIGAPRAQPSDTAPLAAQRSDSESDDSPASDRPTSTVVIPKAPHFNIRSFAFNSARSHFFKVYLAGATSSTGAFYGRLLAICELSILDFIESLHAYFDFPALYRPFIPEDAFWQDFHADRCGPVLLLAVACRGILCTGLKNREKKQRRLATMFRAEFMKAMTSKARTSTVCLDVLEGMALMVDFNYDDARTPADHSWNLFMTHDALVLLTLQSRKRGPGNLDPSASFASADERFTLLYWDVFGLDAFECLDDKSMSLISDDAFTLTEDLLNHEAGSYLDAILSLSIIARRIVGKLCNAAASAAGIACEDITVLHEQLSHWRHNTLPLELQRPIDRENEFPAEDRTTRESTPIPVGRKVRLQRAILWALEIHCYLQIDDCVAQYGLKNGNSIQAEIFNLKCLQVVLEAVNMANTIKEYRPGDQYSEKPLVDLAPSILRNVCAGLCCWVCSRGMESLELHEPQVPDIHSSSREGRLQTLGKDAKAQRRADYAELAKTFRDSVAAASSHRDTKQIVEHLDDQIAPLQDV
ncbi:hypothetical protein N7522_006458 [Penicillium canescens]|nr:hypothetical protein N7522_006458 [Penicillium canescens]